MRVLRILAAAGLAVLFGTAPVQAKSTSFTAKMSAGEEVPDKGPSGGAGNAVVDINTDTNQVCYKLTTTGLPDAITLAHIHEGPKGTAGPIAIDFNYAANGQGGCVAGDAAKVSAVVANPAGFYVNVHTAQFPKGALRGQLEPALTTQPSALGSLPRTGGSLAGLLAALGLGLTGLGASMRRATRRN
jgi:LPXTG-motif cell wall-anchored protein